MPAGSAVAAAVVLPKQALLVQALLSYHFLVVSAQFP
jgi:hypothetical protein